jgi:hypothetical protein
MLSLFEKLSDWLFFSDPAIEGAFGLIRGTEGFRDQKAGSLPSLFGFVGLFFAWSGPLIDQV